ncbi:MAG: hypothetical protein HS111_08515 [Kofleriaceae bacterium]|nr:hypothetical protein [Kofleriaceae bacterium]
MLSAGGEPEDPVARGQRHRRRSASAAPRPTPPRAAPASSATAWPAGAGQLALALAARRALAQASAPAAGATQTAQAAAPRRRRPSRRDAGAALPPPIAAPAARPANSASGAGYVVDVFREAASQLDALDEDQWRMGMRDGADGGADVYDLDDLMAA